MSTTYVLGFAIAIAVLLTQRFLSDDRAQWWLGALPPVAWLIFVAILVTRVLDTADRDIDGRAWLAFGAGLVLLLSVWIEAHDARVKRLRAEDQRIDALNALPS